MIYAKCPYYLVHYMQSVPYLFSILYAQWAGAVHHTPVLVDGLDAHTHSTILVLAFLQHQDAVVLLQLTKALRPHAWA